MATTPLLHSQTPGEPRLPRLCAYSGLHARVKIFWIGLVKQTSAHVQFHRFARFIDKKGVLIWLLGTGTPRTRRLALSTFTERITTYARAVRPRAPMRLLATCVREENRTGSAA